jgi:hypothetical protein
MAGGEQGSPTRIDRPSRSQIYALFSFVTLTRLLVDGHFENRQADVIAVGAIIHRLIRSSSRRFLYTSLSFFVLTPFHPPEVHATTYKFNHWHHIRTNT